MSGLQGRPEMGCLSSKRRFLALLVSIDRQLRESTVVLEDVGKRRPYCGLSATFRWALGRHRRGRPHRLIGAGQC